MNELEKKLKKIVSARKKIVCAFLTLGYPTLAHTKKMIIDFEKSGVDLIELGFPFSDPLADGPTIQASSEFALQKGAKLAKAFQLVSALRKEGTQIPIVLFSYVNPIFHYGISSLAKKLHTSGFQGAVIPDLPPEEAYETEREFSKNNLDLVYLIAPTTAKKRAHMIAKKSKGFIYYVSLKGVTGARKMLPGDIAHSVKELRGKFKKPVLVGFGVSTSKQVKEICRFSDGVIVGSAIIDCLKRTKFSTEKTSRFMASLVRAANGS